ncbi:MAG: sigma D regulator [Porticoccus sp.]|nr:sigma D regulator [Porticoccus sp.]MBQ0808380.1 sigma D regulator [Porticoccus sp.]
MLKNCKSAQERWGGVSALIDRWLEGRRDVLVEFCALGDIQGFDSKNTLHREKLKTFCEILVDYTSAGHFEIYDQLVQEGKDLQDSQGLEAANGLLETIDASTEMVLDFNDKYLETDDLKTLATDLSQLGESLEARLAAEDQMIEVLHTAHSEKVMNKT